MHAEIIAIGDEITSGQLLDTNSQWLSQRLEDLGIRVLYHTTVGDELEPICDVFRRAVQRADVIIATGGLGPTADDLTRQAIAQAAGRPLVVDEAALAHVRGIFARRNRPMPASNEVQGLLPQGSRMIHNPHGTAPGIEIQIPKGQPKNGLPVDPADCCHVYALPGVPAEMREMWFGSLESALRQIGGGRRVVLHRKLKCFGVGESQLEAMLPDLIRRGRQPRVGINASGATIILRITAEGASDEECCAAMEPTVATIRQCLGNLVFGEGDDELQHAVCRLLKSQEKTLSTVEWGSAGQVADWLAAVPEAGQVYAGGLVVTSPLSAQRSLDLTADLFARHQAVSQPVAAALAHACRARFGTHYALAVGPFPQHDPQAATPSSFHLALAAPDGLAAKTLPYAAHPAILKTFCAKLALDFLRHKLLQQ